MEIEEFVESLSIEEYIKLEKIIISKKYKKEYRIKISEFIDKNKDELGGIEKKGLELLMKNNFEYMDEFNRRDISSLRFVGYKTANDLGKKMKINGIDTTYYESVIAIMHKRKNNLNSNHE